MQPTLSDTGTAHVRQKVVFVLGAGFSIPAGAPSQAEILADIFRLDQSDARVHKARESLRQFLGEALRIDIDRPEQIALEDIYTPMDRCIADGTSFKSASATELEKLRGDLQFLISRAIANRISERQRNEAQAKPYIRNFARYVVSKAAHRAKLAAYTDSSLLAKEYDPLSIISLNWDILLDNALHWELQEECGKTGDYDPFGVVDYCCYVSSLDRGDPRIRSGLWSLGCRGYNVKLLKLHGSMNWLQCPNCQRLFVQFGNKENILDRIGNVVCRHCGKCGYRNSLGGSLVMPTFLKDLSNFQLKLVWQNAGVELMEATRIVFIGYSLPQADFEFRQLLSRMIHPDAEIEVVLYEGTSEESRRNYQAEKQRYAQFFGTRRTKFHPSGVIGFVEDITRCSDDDSLDLVE